MQKDGIGFISGVRAVREPDRDHAGEEAWRFVDPVDNLALGAIGGVVWFPAGQAPVVYTLHFHCDCVPHLGPPHCHGCSGDSGPVVTWAKRSCPEGVGFGP